MIQTPKQIALTDGETQAALAYKGVGLVHNSPHRDLVGMRGFEPPTPCSQIWQEAVRVVSPCVVSWWTVPLTWGDVERYNTRWTVADGPLLGGLIHS